MADLKEGSDYYFNSQGLVVFTSEYLLKRGHCCLSGCLHCPYSLNHKIDPNIPTELQLGPIDKDNSDFEND